ncbi:uncharacterized protein METZ01_LOCUS228377 [marine metagenome]|uniref:Uncharacterized protein n=1 Tax=marine metagenome TaxID=408172 RepID=A0A382GLP5_9ZZZZ
MLSFAGKNGGIGVVVNELIGPLA